MRVIPVRWLAMLALLFYASLHAESLDPRQLVAVTVDEVLVDMRTNAATYSADPGALQAMVLERAGPHFNFPRMAQLAMARHWAEASGEQRANIARELRSLLVRTYANALFDFRDSAVRVMGEQRSSERASVVRVRVDSRSGQPMDVQVRFENRNDRWQVVDVVVGGVSLVITFRGAFNDRIVKSGIDGLIDEMRSGNLGVEVQ